MNPRTQDARNDAAGWALDEAVEDTREFAGELGVTPRTVRRYRNGHQSNRVAKFGREVLENADHPWRIVQHLAAWVKWQKVREMTTRELVERWHALADLEHEKEARQNRARQNGTSAEEEVRADEAHSAVLTELAAVRFELHIRDVDPRSFDRETT